MIGSLGEFMPFQGESFWQGEDFKEEEIVPLPRVIKRRGKSTVETFVPDDKTDLLVRYQKNNIYQINRKKYNEIAK